MRTICKSKETIIPEPITHMTYHIDAIKVIHYVIYLNVLNVVFGRLLLPKKVVRDSFSLTFKVTIVGLAFIEQST